MFFPDTFFCAAVIVADYILNIRICHHIRADPIALSCFQFHTCIGKELSLPHFCTVRHSGESNARTGSVAAQFSCVLFMRPQLKGSGVERFGIAGIFSHIFLECDAVYSKPRSRRALTQIELQDQVIRSCIRCNFEFLDYILCIVCCYALPVECFIALFDITVVIADFKVHIGVRSDIRCDPVFFSGFRRCPGIHKQLGLPDTVVISRNCRYVQARSTH